MKNLLIVVLFFGLGGAAFGQTYRSKLGGEKVRAAPTPPPAVSQRGNAEGAVPAAIRGGNPLQMLNPKAPAQYGTAGQHVILDPETGKWRGIKLFEIFW
jgi:hypothetical protein